MSELAAIWDREYALPQMMSLDTSQPQTVVKDFARFLRKQWGDLQGRSCCDLWCGVGKNTFYFASLGFFCVGVDISSQAVQKARTNDLASECGVEFLVQDISEPFDQILATRSYDILLDVTSSNALTDQERSQFLQEADRILAPGGYFFVRALCKDGDTNAKKLVLNHPYQWHKDMYVMPVTGFRERVFTETDLRAVYSEFFDIVSLKKEFSYARFGSQSYKRAYWILILQKKKNQIQ